MSWLLTKWKYKRGIANGTILNDAVLDLRKYTPKALEHVKTINAAVILLPANPTDEFMEAYSKIQINSAASLSLDEEKRINNLSGINTLEDNIVDLDAIYILSGISAIKKITCEKPIDVIASGITLYEKGSNINFISKSGITKEIDYEIKDIKTINGSSLQVDSEFIKLANQCVIICSGGMTVSKDVTPALLQDSNIYFVIAGNVHCSRQIRSILQLQSTISGKVIIDG